MASPKWLSKAAVIAIHRESIQRFGGPEGTRDEGLLESALARPRNLATYEPDTDLFALAASYCAGIVQNHPFVDGNKRTGILSAAAFLYVNGRLIQANEPDVVVMVLGLAAGDVSEDQLAGWSRTNHEER